MSLPRSILLCLAVLWMVMAGGCASRPPQSAALLSPMPVVREALAPGGVLRVGVYGRSPYSMQSDGRGGYVGLAHDLGIELARWLGVSLELVEFGNPARVLEAVRSEDVDVTLAPLAEAQRLGLDATLPLLNAPSGALTLVIPRGRHSGMSYLSRFALTVRRDGTLDTVVRRAGLGDVVTPAGP
jgi:polar amino acid transport system substrate-binding protein